MPYKDTCGCSPFCVRAAVYSVLSGGGVRGADMLRCALAEMGFERESVFVKDSDLT